VETRQDAPSWLTYAALTLSLLLAMGLAWALVAAPSGSQLPPAETRNLPAGLDEWVK
jgi:hypothetical protein